MRKWLTVLGLSVLAGVGAPASAQPFCPGLTPWVFDDVPATDPFCGYITWMAVKGVTLGCAEINPYHRLYCPNDVVSRGQMAAFMNRLGDALFPLGCATGQVMKWDGAAWNCANDNVGGGGSGTVTSVLVGAGLLASPNPITTSGSINLAATQLLPTSPCATGQLAKWNGAAWQCQVDANSGGTVTSVATGAGLAGGPITGSGTVSVAAGGISTTQLAANAVTAAKVADAAITKAKLSAGAGSAGQLLGTDGAALQWIDAPATLVPINALGNTTTVVDSAGIVGHYTSIARGLDGRPVISYVDVSNGTLKVAKCANAACTGTSTLTTVDTVCSSAAYAAFTSITAGTDGFPVISYVGGGGGACSLKVAKCANPACTGASTITTVDANASTGWYNSITLGADGFPVISYRAGDPGTPGRLKVAKCANAACTGAATITSVDVGVSSTGVGLYSSIALGADGLPVIGYWDQEANRLKVAKCSDAACSAAGLEVVDNGVGECASIALGADGLPVVSYYDRTNGSVKVAKCANASCSSPSTLSTVDTVGDVGWFTSITIGQDGLPVIAYYDNTNHDLKVAKCGNAACTGSSTISMVDSAGDVGWFSAITLGADGLPALSYHDVTNGNLKVAKCSSPTCMPYVRSR